MTDSGGDRVSKLDLSILISTWNNSRRLAITLDSISRCIIPPGLKWELVLVNNNCTDETDGVVQEFADVLPIVYVHELRPGAGRGRNTGLKTAAGRLIVLTDDDVKPCWEWIATYWSAYLEKPTGFYFGGPVESEFETVSPDEELLRLAPASVRGMHYGPYSRKLAKHEYFIGPNWACPAKALRALGGYNILYGGGPVGVGEETDLMHRLDKMGFFPWYVPAARVVHFVPARNCTLKHIAARAEVHGIDQASKFSEGQQVPSIWKIPRWMYREVFVLWAKWIWARARGKKGYQEYVSLQLMIGTMKGVRELGRAVGDATH